MSLRVESPAAPHLPQPDSRSARSETVPLRPPTPTSSLTISRTSSHTTGTGEQAPTSSRHDAPVPTTRSHSSPIVTSQTSWQSNGSSFATSTLPRHSSLSYPTSTSNSDRTWASLISLRQQSEGVQDHVQPREEKRDNVLAADDGMRALRQKLHEIRTLAISTEERAQRMHELMTQGYRTRVLEVAGDQNELVDEHGEYAVDAPSLRPNSLQSDNPYNIHPDDLIPQVSPLASTEFDTLHDHSISDDRNQDGHGGIPSLLGCMHYKRNVKIQCFDCAMWFPCRHCHDASHHLPFPHALNRQKTRNMLCMLCSTPQPAAEICIACGEYAAWYYCSKCKLWDNDSNKSIYHCDDCGICRVGQGLGKDFVHCRRCNVCISIAAAASHPCIEGATEGDCPLCLIRLFESKTPVVGLPCGHYMHGDCYKDLMAVTYKCPVCSKSAVNMELQWRKLDDEIRAQPMPEDDADLNGLLPNATQSMPPPVDSNVEVPDSGQAVEGQPTQAQRNRGRTVWIGCNDCTRRCWTPFHWLGLKCQVCDSYNTIQMAPTAVRETDIERVLRQQHQQHHREHDLTGDDVLRSTGLPPPTRSVRFLDVPTSPAQHPIAADEDGRVRPQSPSSPHSPGRRYFVEPTLPRRSSFGAPRFSTPSLPTIPNFPRLPEGLTRMPRMPNLPNLPNMPNIDFPRFSPYDMFSAVSRSLSPMTYYLQGDGPTATRPVSSQAQAARPRLRERVLSNASTRSEPVLPSARAALKPSSPSFGAAMEEDDVSFRTRIRDLLLADDGLGHDELEQDDDDDDDDDDDEDDDDDDDDDDEYGYEDDDDDDDVDVSEEESAFGRQNETMKDNNGGSKGDGGREGYDSAGSSLKDKHALAMINGPLNDRGHLETKGADLTNESRDGTKTLRISDWELTGHR